MTWPINAVPQCQENDGSTFSGRWITLLGRAPHFLSQWLHVVMTMTQPLTYDDSIPWLHLFDPLNITTTVDNDFPAVERYNLTIWVQSPKFITLRRLEWGSLLLLQTTLSKWNIFYALVSVSCLSSVFTVVNLYAKSCLEPQKVSLLTHLSLLGVLSFQVRRSFFDRIHNELLQTAQNSTSSVYNCCAASPGNRASSAYTNIPNILLHSPNTNYSFIFSPQHETSLPFTSLFT